MTFYTQNNSGEFSILAGSQGNTTKMLPAGVYNIGTNMHGFILEPVPMFELPQKLYGNIKSMSDRILKTFNDRKSSTGVLLVGEKGSGKSLLAKSVGLQAIAANIPVLIVAAPYKGAEFNQFIATIEQDCVILFDEFEKFYDKQDQSEILGLLDGTITQHKLFILTANDKWEITSNMINRPGRIYYYVEYNGIDFKFAKEYCADNLNDKSVVNEVVLALESVQPVNFDMLQCLVEEVNRYGDSPRKLLSIMNIKPNWNTATSEYKVEVFKNDELIPIVLNKYGTLFVNPFSNNIQITFDDTQTKKRVRQAPILADDIEYEVAEKKEEYLHLRPKDIVDVTGKKITYVYKDYRVEMTRVDWESLACGYGYGEDDHDGMYEY